MQMIWRAAGAMLLLAILVRPVDAQTVNCNIPYSFIAGTTADPDKVNANFTAVQTCIQTALGQIKPGGWVNVLRNASLSQWYSGLTGVTGWTAEGVFCFQTGGGGVTGWSQVANPLSAPRGIYGLKLWNTSSPAAGLTCRFLVESHDAIRIAGQTVTFQLSYLNMSGGTVTPTITTSFPTAQDNWAASTTDLVSTNLQSCPNTSTCTAAYTFVSSGSAINGYKVSVTFANTGVGPTNYVVFGGGFDLRASPGIPIGLNSSPPTGEIRSIGDDFQWNQRFYETSYANWVAPGTITSLGSEFLIGSTIGGTAGKNASFKVMKQCAAPAISVYSPVTGAAAKIRDLVNNVDVVANTTNSGMAGFHWFGSPSAGASVSFQMHWVADCRI